MKSSMTAKFWGVRGSIPSPGSSTVRYGGNTSCVSLHLPDERVLVFDAGIGIRQLGKTLAASANDLFIILSHPHWDHIQGFPFFGPIYEPNRKIHLFPTRLGRTMLCALLEQMDGAHFPVTADSLPSQTMCVTTDEVDFLCARGVHISRVSTNHPGGGFGFRVEDAGRSLVYLSDNELNPPYAKTTEFDGFAQFCRHADVLIHDAQYLEQDMPLKHGWGHSLVSQACSLAAAAEVKHLVLYHHDPDRADQELDAIQESARGWFAEHNRPVECTVAYEGLTLET
jgi:phosphoribosyl 1,2-cyclic phosphodiesterase